MSRKVAVAFVAHATQTLAHIPKPFHPPLSTEPRESPLAREQLLHGGLLEGTLLCDELVQPADQGIRIAQCRSD